MIPNKKVKIAMLNQDITIRALADRTGYTRPHLSGVINGRYESPRAKRIIALALNGEFSDLWDNRSEPV